MNWTDFIIAIKQGLIPSKKELVDGTTKVGNSNKLDGHGAEYFATVEELSKIDGTKDLSTSILEKALTLEKGIHEFALGGGNYSGNDLPKVAFAYGNATVFVKQKAYALGVVLWGSSVSGGNTFAVNQYNGAEWIGWDTFATTAELANYFSLTGGTIDGNVNVLSNGEVVRNLRIGNALRTLDIGVNAVGGGYINDVTNNEPLCEFLADGRKFFHGIATENLQLKGGAISGNVNFNSTAYISGKLSARTIEGRDNGGNGDGELHLNYSNGKKVYINGSEALHSGNSAKVHIGSSAPSDTSALWIDTSA